VQDVLATIRRMRAEGIAVLVVEQNPMVALAVSDRAYVLDHGTVAYEGQAQALLADRALRERLLGL
jgi:branched-chain amino acid transport system ATP-binding protein